MKNKIDKRTVAIVIFYDQKGNILLQNRKGIDKSGEEWGFFGGGLEKNETPKESLKREVKEEIGHKLKNYKFIGEYENQYFNPKTKRQRKIHRFIFISSFTKDLLNKKVIEGTGSKLFNITEAKKLKLIPGDDKVLDIVEKFLQKESGSP